MSEAQRIGPGNCLTNTQGCANSKDDVYLSLIHICNAYPTCPSLGDNLAKVRLIPNDISRRHLKEIKDLSVMDGDASD